MIVEPLTVQPLSANQLAVLFGFTLDELAQNRAGTFSQRQRQQLAYQSVGYLLRGMGFLLLSLILAISLYGRIEYRWQIAAFAAVCLLLLTISGYLLFATYRVFSPSVQRIDGKLSKTGSAQVLIGERMLRISYRRWKRLPASFPGEYRVYYARTVYNLLSIEPLLSDDNRYAKRDF